MSQSEIANLRQQIENEAEAMKRGLNGYATVGKHEIIANHYQAIGNCHQQLTDIVGPKEAIAIIANTLEKIF